MITKKLNKTSRKMGANYVYRLEELGTVCSRRIENFPKIWYYLKNPHFFPIIMKLSQNGQP